MIVWTPRTKPFPLSVCEGGFYFGFWINWAVELWLMVVLKEIVEEDLQWKEAATEGKDKEVNGSSAD